MKALLVFVSLVLLLAPLRAEVDIKQQIGEFIASVLYTTIGQAVNITEMDDGIHQFINYERMSLDSLMNNPVIYETMLDRLLNFDANDRDEVKLTCTKGNKADFYKLASMTVGVLGKSGSSQKITLDKHDDDCYDHIDAEFSMGNGQVKLTLTPGIRKANSDKDCKETLTVGSTLTMTAVILKDENKPHTITIRNVQDKKLEDIQKFGLHVFRTCDPLNQIIPDLLLTLGLYLGGLGLNPDIPVFGSHPTWWQEYLNVLFIKQGTGYEWKKRDDVFIDLDKSQVKSGDFVIVTRFDGLDQLIQWGCGTRSGHSVVILEFDNETWAIESNDAWYWPVRGFQRNKWDDWKKYARNAGHNVAILPMREDIRAKFNVSAAAEWFKKYEGTPYGYHNFIYGWFDTPDKSLPPITDVEFLYVIFCIVHNFIPAGINSIVGEAMNMRLGTKNLSLHEVAMKAADMNMTIGDLFSMVEKDEWVYSDGISRVCSAFVASIYKAGGLFGDYDVNAAEFTPRDVYQLNFFDKNYQVPEECKKVNPELPYCQIMGKHVMDITDDGWSTIDPYEHMFEHCPSQPPFYNRTLGC